MPVVYADERVLMAHEGPLFVVGWSDAPTSVQMEAMAEHGRRCEARTEPLALVNVVFGGVPKFPEEVRVSAAALTRDATLFARSRAHVVMLPGFAGAAVMAFINTFMLLGRPPRPTRVFRALDPAVEWTAQASTPELSPAAIHASVEQVRVRLGERGRTPPAPGT